jgi:hypothetical protein
VAARHVHLPHVGSDLEQVIGHANRTLAVMEPAKPGHDRLTFECTECGREDPVEARIAVKLSEAA